MDRLAFRPNADNEPVSLQMRQACITHDYCYRHGDATYRYSQEDCDYILLEHALRLCLFIAKGNKIDQTKCQQRAKKVLLGVRLGGNLAFKTADAETKSEPDRGKSGDSSPDVGRSTYFEYDPYPLRSFEHSVYRIADAPADWQASGLLRKALYVFAIRQSGIRVTILSWNPDGKTTCAGITLPGSPGYLTTAPIVTAMQPDDGPGEDWFIWWQRYKMRNTGGRFVGIAPRRASLADWRKVVPGAGSFDPKCDAPSSFLDRAVPLENKDPAYLTAKTGFLSGRDDENNSTEFYPAPGLGSARRLRLLSLRVHSCTKDKNVLCISDFELDPAAPVAQPHKALLVKDHINKYGVGPEPRRYRNFGTPPIPLASGDQRPILGWIRRGRGASGGSYDMSAEFRRVKCALSSEQCAIKDNPELIGAGVGVLHLEDFCESDEPVAVLGRNQLRPRLVSVSTVSSDACRDEPADDARIRISFWHLHPPESAEEGDQSSAPVGRSQMRGDCVTLLKESWIIRPPLVWGLPDGSGKLVFTRAILSKDHSNLKLEIWTATVSTDNTCNMDGDSELLDTSLEAGSSGAEALRRVPLLIVPNPRQSHADVILPNHSSPGSSEIFPAFIDLSG